MRIVQSVRSDGFAGVEQYVTRLALAQAASGHDVVVVGGEPERTAAVLDGQGVRWLPASTTLEVHRQLRRLRTWDPQIIHAHMTAAETAALLPRRAWRRAPVVATRHFASRRGGSRLRSGVFRLFDGLLSEQIAVSAYVAATAGTQLCVVHPGIDERPEPVAARAPTVLLAQRLEPEKESAVALRGFASSGLAAAGWRLLIAGSGSEEPDLRRLADRLDIAGSTSFLGHRGDIARLLDESSILLSPTRIEGFGLTALESMAAGLPVVAAAGGGHLETVGAVTPDLLFPPGDHVRAGNLLSALATDAERRARCGAALRDVQRTRFSTAQMVRRIDEIYARVV
ncbi:glycosyltransferase family 4 protein [Flexivirga meconopsidis]|uniref:glycosyltransferase family 4 protein n=1 Tax=Flexivirga meconopsidis TaxID=2977121 RepID=UPI002240B766|nr:glycosyltransferase family 4 protein [Flexivirga meconopsidis]